MSQLHVSCTKFNLSSESKLCGCLISSFVNVSESNTNILLEYKITLVDKMFTGLLVISLIAITQLYFGAPLHMRRLALVGRTCSRLGRVFTSTCSKERMWQFYILLNNDLY